MVDTKDKAKWQMLDCAGKWVDCDGEPEADKIRRMNYGEYHEIYHGVWKDGEEAIYRKIK
jgi:hypothetical protein